MKRFAALLAIVLLVVSFASISAQEKEAPKADDSKCTAVDSETKVKFQKLKLQYELEMVDLKAEKETIHKEMMEELLKEDTSTKTLEKLGKSMNSLQYKMHKAKMDYVLKVKKILPADHWKAFLTKQHGGSHGCAPGCKKPCCATKTSGCKSSCSTSASKCSMAGTKGHTCTTACASASTKGCKTPCVKVKK